MLYAMVNFYGIIPVKKAYEILTENYGEDILEEAFLDFCEYIRYEQQEHFYIFGKEEKSYMKEWASDMGWTGRMVKPENIL